MSTLLFFRPDKDLAMQYAKDWVGAAVQHGIDAGYITLDMLDSEATKENLEELMANETVNLAILTGHGGPNVFTGFEQRVVLQTGLNEEVMKNTISHFLSCSLGQQLLPALIDHGAISTIGYIVDFQFMIDTTYPVAEDPFAEPFKDVTVTIIRSILEGKPLKAVWEAGIAKSNEWIAKLWEREGTDWAEVISCLENNRDGMIALGDKEAYFSPPKMAFPSSLAPLLPIAIGLGLVWIL